MSGAPGFLRVTEHVARNPVARAIAAQRTRRAARDFAIRIRLLADGEQMESDAMAAAQVPNVAGRALELDGRADTPGARIIRGGLSALQQLSERVWRWRTADAGAIDLALLHGIEAVTVLPAAIVQRAWADAAAVEAEVAAERRAAA